MAKRKPQAVEPPPDPELGTHWPRDDFRSYGLIRRRAGSLETLIRESFEDARELARELAKQMVAKQDSRLTSFVPFRFPLALFAIRPSVSEKLHRFQ